MSVEPPRLRPALFACLLSAVPGHAYAQQAPQQASPPPDVAALQNRIVELQSRSDEQEGEIRTLKSQIDQLILSMRGTGLGPAPAGGEPPASPVAGPTPASAGSPSDAPPADAPQSVGQAPSSEGEIAQRSASIPQQQGVLTPKGHLVYEPSLEYLRAANDRLVFAGFELIPGLQVGAIQAQTAQQDTLVPTATLRYGLTRRIELELRVPAMYRYEDIGVVQQREGQLVNRLNLHALNIGDVEGTLRYQINATSDTHAIWIASLRVKSDTGIGPYNVRYDNYGIAKSLPTGSGFWAVQPGMSFLLPSDPGVIYGSLNYIYQFSKALNRVVAGTLIEDVRPGGAITGNLGFGFALNPRFSFSLGYSHAYVMATKTDFAGQWQSSGSLQVGSLDLGASYKLSNHEQFNIMFQFGVTPDAPNLNVTVRIPIML